MDTAKVDYSNSKLERVNRELVKLAADLQAAFEASTPVGKIRGPLDQQIADTINGSVPLVYEIIGAINRVAEGHIGNIEELRKILEETEAENERAAHVNSKPTRSGPVH
ncbi:hypothetical protein [Dactylosporangium darangshiense]|uniref:hypothetical protein n=1 Tax=Dactylosporangium darangshiense TaxID=579108 RepID=UPI00362D5B66